jgi:hypothetical protein
MFLYQIFHKVFEKFPGLPKKLAVRRNKSAEWFSSHGRVPASLDAYGTGNDCPEVKRFVELAEDYEACKPGAGSLLAQLVYAELRCRFSAEDEDCTLRELRHGVVDEARDVIRALDECEFHEARQSDIERWNVELSELIQIAEKAQMRVNTELQKREIRQQNGLHIAA